MNLTETAKMFKKSVLILGGVVVFYYILILVLIPTAKNVSKKIIPDPNPPTLAYGILPALEFTTKTIQGRQAYELNTPNGRLPNDLPTRELVYQIKPTPFSYNAGKYAQENANYLGFSDSDLVTDLKGNIYKWRSLDTSGNLEIDINSKKLLLNTPMSGKGNLYKAGTNTDNSVKKISSDMLLRIGRIDNMYYSGSQTVSKGKYVNNKIIHNHSDFLLTSLLEINTHNF